MDGIRGRKATGREGEGVVDETIVAGSAMVDQARTMWAKAVTVDATPTMSIKTGRGHATRDSIARVHPGARRLDITGGVPGHGEENDFSLLNVLGKGGMGIVYSARQASLDREIAIKMLKTHADQDEDAVRKFLAEAAVTGELDHPNIVPVYDMGRTPDGALFYAMKEVVGTSWDKVIRQKSLDENLRILLSVCDAVAFAHSKGVLHRDLKPENVMLGDFGEIYVMDWGLAVGLSGGKAAELQGETGLAGTPAYMAPEMALCDFGRVGTASEIYLLGGILYEIVTGLRPHAGSDVYSCIAAAMENEIQPTDKKGELVEIALKAMAANPAERYPSVRDLQQAIRVYESHAGSLRFSDRADERRAALAGVDEKALYREATEIVASYQQALGLWAGNKGAAHGLRKIREILLETAVKRGDLALAQSELAAMENEEQTYPMSGRDVKPLPALAGSLKAAVREAALRRRVIWFSAAVAVSSVAAALWVMTNAYRVARLERDRAQEAERFALKDRDRAAVAETEAVRQRHESQKTLFRVEQENYYNLIALAERRISEARTDQAEALLWNAPRELRGWEWGFLLFLCHRDLASFEGHTEQVFSMAFSPDSKQLVTAGHDKRVILWNAGTGEAILSLATDGSALSVAFSADGKAVMVVTRDGNVRSWDPVSRRPLSVVALKNYSPDFETLGLSADGRFCLGRIGNREVRTWETSSGQGGGSVRLPGDTPAVEAAALSPDGTAVALAGSRSVSVWDTRAGSRVKAFALEGHVAPLLWIAYSPDGKRLVTGSRDGTARVWDADTGKGIAVLRGNGGAVSAAAISPDGALAATVGYDRRIRIWDAQCCGEFAGLAAHKGAVTSLSVSRDGLSLLTAGGEGPARVWDAATARERRALGAQGGIVTFAALSADGQRAATAGQDGVARIWDMQTGRELPSLKGRTDPLTSAVFSPDGQTVVTAGKTTVISWNVADGRELKTIDTGTSVQRTVAFSPDGRYLAIAGLATVIRDMTADREVARLDEKGGAVGAVAFSSDSRRLLTGGREGAKVWDLGTFREIRAIDGGGGAVSAGVFSPDGRRIVTGGMGIARVWDAETGRELVSLAGHSGWITGLAFSSDGRTLWSAGDDGTVKMWVTFDPALAPADLDRQVREIREKWQARRTRSVSG